MSQTGSTRIITWILMGLFGASSAVTAQGETNGTATLPEIVVTATRTKENPVEIPQSVLNVTAQDIQKRQPSQPAEAVRDEPGVWIQKTGSGGGTPVVRGLMGNQVLYLVDGIRINNGRLFSGPNAFFNQVDIGSIEQIEILKGPGSVQYGSDALGGVIQLRSKTLNRFPETPDYGGMLSGHYSSANEGKYGHGELYYANEDYNALVGGTYFSAEDYRAGGDEGVLDNTSLNSKGALGKVQYKLGEGHVLTLGYLENIRTDVERYDQSKRNQPSGIPRYFTPREDRQIIYLRDSLDRPDSIISHLEPYVYYQNYSGRSDYNVESETDIRRDKTDQDQTQYGGGIQAVTPFFDTLKLVYGFDGRYEYAKEVKTRYTQDKATGKTTASTPKGLTPDGSYDVVDAFLMADWTPIEKARLTAGTRLESTHLNSKPEKDDVSAGFTVDDLKVDERWNSLTYSVGGIYWLTENLALDSDVATGFRAPTYSDVLSFGPFTYGINVPSPDVSPEKSINWEIGPRFDSKTFKAQVTWFQTWLDDLIDSQPTGDFIDMNGNGVEDPGEATYAKENSGEGWIHGIESSADWQFMESLGAFGSFNWTEGRNDTKDDPLRFIPPPNGILGLRYQPIDRIRIELYARMVTAQTQVSSDDKSDPARATDPAITFPSKNNPPLREDYSIPGYTTYHVKTSYEVKPGSTVFLLADNLTDKKYREAFSRQDAQGVSITLGLETHF
jgi:hemoglobin/transferrin/lactoferrin receptor protein